MNTIQVTNNDWQTKNLTIKNATHQVLKNGRVIPTASNMLRKASKI